MRIEKISRAELERMAREQYRKHFDRPAPEPRIVNADALVAFCGTARLVEWRSVRYHAPPLQFATAVRLLVMANTLRDLTAQGYTPLVLQRVADTAATLLHQTLTPTSRIRRWFARVRRNPFLGAAPTDVQGIVNWLLHVPDNGAVAPPSGQQVTIDMVDDLATFARELPAWVGPDGLPLSWAHYVYGTRHIGRAVAREDLRAAASVRVAQADKNGWRDYEREQRAAGGW